MYQPYISVCSQADLTKGVVFNKSMMQISFTLCLAGDRLAASIRKDNDVMWKRGRGELQGCRGEKLHFKCSGRALFLKRGHSHTPASVKFVYILITHLHRSFFSVMSRLPEKHKIRTEVKRTFIILRGCCFCNYKPHLYLGNKGMEVGFKWHRYKSKFSLSTYFSTFIFLLNNATLNFYFFGIWSWYYNV